MDVGVGRAGEFLDEPRHERGKPVAEVAQCRRQFRAEALDEFGPRGLVIACDDLRERRRVVRRQPRQRREALTVPPVGVVAGDGVDHRLGVRFGAPDDLVGVAKPAQILQHENEVVGRRVEGGVVRTRGLQRVAEADLLVEADFPHVEIRGFAQLRPGGDVQGRELDDHGRRHARSAVEMGPEQPAQQSDTDRDLFEPAFAHVGAENFAEPRWGYGLGIDGNDRHLRRLPPPSASGLIVRDRGAISTDTALALDARALRCQLIAGFVIFPRRPACGASTRLQAAS